MLRIFRELEGNEDFILNDQTMDQIRTEAGFANLLDFTQDSLNTEAVSRIFHFLINAYKWYFCSISW